MAVHKLKIKPKYFEQLITHKKTFEIRFNDRDFEVGDVLHLEEYENGFTEKETIRIISHILKDVPECGLMEGYVILSLY